MSGQHAYLPPSGAAYWVECAAWPMMNATYPQDDTPESQEGTAAHFVFEEPLAGRAVVAGTNAPNGVPITEEMLQGADLYIETLDLALAAAGLDRSALFVEQRLAIPGINPHNWGTPDTWFFAPLRMTLCVFDYKFGHGFVDAFQNWQCVDYTSGIIDKLATHYKMTPGELDQVINVEITVVQPRNYDATGPVRTWRARGSDLRAMWNKLAGAAERALEPNPVATPGPVQCEHCPGSHACTPLQREGYRAARLGGRYAPSPLPPAALATELTMLQDARKMLDARVSGLEAEVEARLRRGEGIAGYALEAKTGRETWSVPVEQVIATARLIGAKVEKPAIVTPRQALAAGMPAELVKSWSHKPSVGVALARVTTTAAEKVFAKPS